MLQSILSVAQRALDIIRFRISLENAVLVSWVRSRPAHRDNAVMRGAGYADLHGAYSADRRQAQIVARIWLHSSPRSPMMIAEQEGAECEVAYRPRSG